MGDLGMWPALATGNAQTVDRIVDLLSVPLPNGETVADRVMYGSDWLMLSFKGRWKTYATNIQTELVAAGVPLSTLEKIYHENAVKLFG